MERNGVILDLEDLKAITINLREDILTLEKEIYTLAGTEFNISSPKQLGDILFIRLKLDEKARVTKTKQFITNEEILQRLTNKHPIIDKVLEYRGIEETTYQPMLRRFHYLLIKKPAGFILHLIRQLPPQAG